MILWKGKFWLQRQILAEFWPKFAFSLKAPHLISGMLKISPVFQTITVAKPLVTEGTNDYLMKDIDIIFPVVPHGLL